MAVESGTAVGHITHQGGGLLAVRFDRPVAVVGDVHGRADLLASLLRQLGDVPVLVLGDVGDRGSDTRTVIDLLVARQAQGVLGNHDEWLLALAQGRGFDSFAVSRSMGGQATLDSYGIVGRSPREIEAQAWKIPAAHRAWLEGLSLVIDLEVQGERYWLSHAGIPSHRALAGLPVEEVMPLLAALPRGEVLWSSTGPNTMRRADRTVIMGHLPRRAPLDAGWVIAIDTGAGSATGGGMLTAVILPERRFVLQPPRHLSSRGPRRPIFGCRGSPLRFNHRQQQPRAIPPMVRQQGDNRACRPTRGGVRPPRPP